MKGVVVDTISNMLISIKNAQAVGKETVEIPYSKLKLEIAKILKKEGFIDDYKIISPFKFAIKLKYKGKEPCIGGLQRLSKPGRRLYAKNKEIPSVLGGLGVVILSTPKGVMTGKEAKKKGLGGELICKIW
uniref:Small ribosomal subunit protein uS8 n=1 Tax=candidate division CPR3 bacterium TaxID=2268181 RepID=A0A7V3JA19_UNCC3